jgi:hypothetical protein
MDEEDDNHPPFRVCPPGFDRFGFGNFVRRRDGMRVGAYFWRHGTVSWVIEREPIGRKRRSGNCLLKSFVAHYEPMTEPYPPIL